MVASATRGSLFLAFLTVTSYAAAQTEIVLYSFNRGTAFGGGSQAGVVIGPGPNGQPVLYGMTPYYGSSNSGMVFSLTPPASPGGSWTEAVLYNFTGGNDGGTPSGVVEEAINRCRRARA